MVNRGPKFGRSSVSRYRSAKPAKAAKDISKISGISDGSLP